MREILFVAGDVSGDQHAARVVAELRARNAPFDLVGVGGDRMQEAGVRLLEHADRLAVMGFTGVLRVIPQLRGLYMRLKQRLTSGNVAALVLVDYGGFNLGFMARAANDAGVPVLYYITPQVWASRPGRIDDIAKYVTKAAVILPFEEKLLRAHGVDATFVGHPLVDRDEPLPSSADARAVLGLEQDARVLALFPGSRRQELARHLSPFVAAAQELQRRMAGVRVVVGGTPRAEIDPALCPFPVVRGQSLTLLRAADAALCKSGTTTLEAAVAECPLIVAYKTGAVDYAVAKRLVLIPNIGLVNVVAGRVVAPEFVQDAVTPMAMANALEPLLDIDSAERRAMVSALREVRASLGESGAARRVATMVLELATGRTLSVA